MLLRQGIIGLLLMLLCTALQAETLMRIHYFRPAADYQGWGLYLWGDGLVLPHEVSWRKPLEPAGAAQGWIYFEFQIRDDTKRVGFILHRGEEKNISQDSWLIPERHGHEIWVKQGDTQIYTQSPVAQPTATEGNAAKATPATSTDLDKQARQQARQQQQALEETNKLLAELRAQSDKLHSAGDGASTDDQRMALAVANKEIETLREALDVKEKGLVSLMQMQQRERDASVAEITVLRRLVEQLQADLAEANEHKQREQSSVPSAMLDQLLGLFAFLSFMLLLWGFSLKAMLRRERGERDAAQAALSMVQVEQASQQQQLLAKASRDPLTGLANRAHFVSALEQAVSKAQRHNKKLAVLFIDLDRFKPINDQFGHEAGDYLLCTIAERFSACLRETDTLARLGGDEFVVLVEELVDPQFVTGVAQKLVAVAQQPVTINGQDVSVTSSIGIAIYPTDGRDASRLLKAADGAMYGAKEHGKNRFQFCSEQMNVHSLQRLALESSLKGALSQQQFQVAYLPVVAFDGGQVTAVETVIRWQHPDFGVVPSGQFLPLAEESGLIVPIGLEMLSRALNQLKIWSRQGSELELIVPVSPRQLLAPRFIADLQRRLRSAQVAPGQLLLCLYEEVVMSNPDELLPVLQAVRELGVRLALDLFNGSALPIGWLRQLDINVLKLDRLLVSGLPDERQSAIQVAAIITLANSLGIRVIASGAKERPVQQWLSEQGCNLGQWLGEVEALAPEMLEPWLGR